MLLCYSLFFPTSTLTDICSDRWHGPADGGVSLLEGRVSDPEEWQQAALWETGDAGAAASQVIGHMACQSHTNKITQPLNIANSVSVNKASVTAEAFSHNLSQWTLSLKLFSSYESVSQQHETLMTMYFILSKYFGSVMNHSCLTAILRHQGFFDFMNIIQSLFKMNASVSIP